MRGYDRYLTTRRFQGVIGAQDAHACRKLPRK
jgi:hypothetical protein